LDTHKNHLKITSKHSFIILYYTSPMKYKTLTDTIREVTGVPTIPEYGSQAFADLIARLDEKQPELATALMHFVQSAGAKGYTHPDEEQLKGARRRAWLSRFGRKAVTDETSEEGGPSSSKMLRLLGIFFAVIMLSALGYGMYQSNQLQRLQFERLNATKEAENAPQEESSQSVQTESGTTMQTQAQPFSQTQNPYDHSDTPRATQSATTGSESQTPPSVAVPITVGEIVSPPALSVEPSKTLSPASANETASSAPPLELTALTPLPPLARSETPRATSVLEPLASSNTELANELEENQSDSLFMIPPEPVPSDTSVSDVPPTTLQGAEGSSEPTQSVEAPGTSPTPMQQHRIETPASATQSETEQFMNELNTTLLEPGQKISVRLATGITIVEGMSSPLLAESLPQWCPIVGVCPTLLFRGRAELISGNKIRIAFDAVIVDGQAQTFQGIALDSYDNTAIAVAVIDEAPTVAQDLIRNTLGGLSGYVDALANAKTLRVLPNGETIEESSVPGLETFLGAAAARTFELPPTSATFVRVAELPAGTPLKVLTGMSF
jgi:hypothetical protein